MQLLAKIWPNNRLAFPPWENLDPPLGEGEGVYEFNERDMKYVLEKYVVVVKNLLNLLRGKLNPIEFVKSCTGML